jgi:hypothetical protein
MVQKARGAKPPRCRAYGRGRTAPGDQSWRIRPEAVSFLVAPVSSFICGRLPFLIAMTWKGWTGITGIQPAQGEYQDETLLPRTADFGHQ